MAAPPFPHALLVHSTVRRSGGGGGEEEKVAEEEEEEEEEWGSDQLDYPADEQHWSDGPEGR